VLDELTTRIADFASVNNLDVADAAQIFQSSLAGETESLRRFGGDVSAAAVETFALTHGLAETKGEITESIKVQARYGLLLQETAKTAGDFANTSDGLANQQRILSANVENLSASFGQKLTPILADAAGTVNNLIASYEDLSRLAPGGKGGPVGGFVNGLISPFTALGGAMEEVEAITGKIDDALGRSAGEFGTFNAVMDRVTPKFNEAGVLMTGFGTAAGTAGDAAAATADELVDLGDKAANSGPKIGDMAGALDDAEQHLADLNEQARDNALGILGAAAQGVADALDAAFGGLEDDLGALDLLDDITDQFDTIAEAQKNATDPKGVRDLNREVRRLQGQLLDYLGTVEDIPPDKVTEIIAQIRTGDIDTLKATLDELTRDRFINIGIASKGIPLFQSANGVFTPGAAPSAPVFNGQTAIPSQPMTTDARTIINNFPVGSSPTSQFVDQQLYQTRNGVNPR
jgi:hypothetical protein